MGYYNKVKRSIRQLAGQEVIARVEWACEHRNIHDWRICPVGIDQNSVVFSLGVGDDIGFDTGMITIYNCHVHAFDPTPRWIEWIKSKNLPQQFHFYPYAIGGTDGSMKLFPRMPNGKPSSTMLTVMNEGVNDTTEGITVTVKRLPTLMAELAVTHIDILKMDIEAAEYQVIDDFLEEKIPVYQLLVEFHHRFTSVPVQKTRDALDKLYKAGYRIFYITEKGREYSFIHVDTCKRFAASHSVLPH